MIVAAWIAVKVTIMALGIWVTLRVAAWGDARVEDRERELIQRIWPTEQDQ